jgi:hypothetical protein
MRDGDRKVSLSLYECGRFQALWTITTWKLALIHSIEIQNEPHLRKLFNLQFRRMKEATTHFVNRLHFTPEDKVLVYDIDDHLECKNRHSITNNSKELLIENGLGYGVALRFLVRKRAVKEEEELDAQADDDNRILPNLRFSPSCLVLRSGERTTIQAPLELSGTAHARVLQLLHAVSREEGDLEESTQSASPVRFTARVCDDMNSETRSDNRAQPDNDKHSQLSAQEEAITVFVETRIIHTHRCISLFEDALFAGQGDFDAVWKDFSPALSAQTKSRGGVRSKNSKNSKKPQACSKVASSGTSVRRAGLGTVELGKTYRLRLRYHYRIMRPPQGQERRPLLALSPLPQSPPTQALPSPLTDDSTTLLRYTWASAIDNWRRATSLSRRNALWRCLKMILPTPFSFKKSFPIPIHPTRLGLVGF